MQSPSVSVNFNFGKVAGPSSGPSCAREICKRIWDGIIFVFCVVILFNVGRNTKVAHVYLNKDLLM